MIDHPLSIDRNGADVRPGTAAALLTATRLRARLSQRELAQRAGVAYSMVGAYETARREPTLPTLHRLIAAAGGRLRVVVEAT